MITIQRCPPSEQLYNNVRAALIHKGTSLNAVCKELNVQPSNAKLALFGSWSGEKGQACVAALLNVAGL